MIQKDSMKRTPKENVKRSLQKTGKPSFVIGKKATHTNTTTQKTTSDTVKKPARQRRSRPFVANTAIAKNAKKSSTKTKRSTTKKRFANKTRTAKHTPKTTDKKPKKVVIPPIQKGHVRIIPLGGVEEVGKNMTVVETYDDIFVFDIGFQFVSEEEIPGIDYIIPNTTFLEERKNKIRAVLITHGHLDHIGGIPFIIDRIGNPPIYTAQLTELLIRKRNEEFPEMKKTKLIPFSPGERIKIGSSYIHSFPVTHSIPDSMGFSIETPAGNIIISGDLRLDHTAGVPSDIEETTWGKIEKENNLFFICDSTNAEQSGFSTDEHTVITNLEKFIKETHGRMIIGTFASQFDRITKIIGIAEKYNKKIVAEGRSIKTNIEIAQRSGRFKPKEDTLIPVEAIGDYPPDRIIVLSTGAQGEEFAALMRIATDKHKHIKLNERDTVLLSSSVIPGNELSVQKLKDNLTRYGLRLINYKTSDIHTSGHGNIEELMWINKKVGAKFFMPGYGYHSMLRSHADGVIARGFPKENIVIADNGNIIDIDPNRQLSILKEKAPASVMAVDGFHIGDIQEVVIRDRKALTKDGIFVIVATVDARTGKVQKSPDIISRGFVYLRENQDLLRQARYIAKKTVEDNTLNVHSIDYDFVKDQVTESIKKFLFKQTNKRPMVLPVILAA
ncbi:MAG: ribonuclease J [Candidatus Pacebacteria bacterium]|nr:ribonuclease J [Candidatus Paceibacterota bacterium]